MPLSSEAAGVSVDAVGACMMSGCDASLITGAECPSAFIGNGSGSSDECAKRRRLLHSRGSNCSDSSARAWLMQPTVAEDRALLCVPAAVCRAPSSSSSSSAISSASFSLARSGSIGSVGCSTATQTVASPLRRGGINCSIKRVGSSSSNNISDENSNGNSSNIICHNSFNSNNKRSHSHSHNSSSSSFSNIQGPRIPVLLSPNRQSTAGDTSDHNLTVEVHAVGHGQSLLACLLASAAQGAQSAQVIDTQNANIVLADELAYKFVSLCSTTQILAFIKEWQLHTWVQQQAPDLTVPVLSACIKRCGCGEARAAGTASAKATCSHPAVGCIVMPRFVATLRDMLLHHHQEQQQQHQQQQQQQQCHQHNSQHYQQGWSSADDPVLTLQLQALAACRRLAALGVRHNDIKTNNFLVDAAGSVRIIDFGQASREPHGYSAAGLFAEELATWSLQYGPREPPGTEVMMECVAYLHNPAAAHPLHSHFCSLL